MNNTLTIKNLSKRYDKNVLALDNISLSISNGMFGILGPNGAGKSSLMRTIATLQSPTAGEVLFNNTNIAIAPLELRKHLGYLPQQFGVYPKMSALALLRHIAILKGITDKKIRHTQVNQLLHQTNLYKDRHRSVHNFSGGMKQRFGIAQALLGNPKLIIVDEPTAGLDPEERNRFLNLLSKIGEQVIVLLSTHIVEDVSNLCTDMAIMGSGKILAHGHPLEMISQIEGKIWQKTIDPSDLSALKLQHKILRTKLNAGRTEIRIYAATNPENGFELVTPCLEDYYFAILLGVISSTKLSM